ncbi:hypothetical protein C8N35_101212 [Breoghania corrubedonensis]|uniref:Uncharacterized protein n=1 Tax=Breoghania corrubedonensis TaxID=665038 RepID=A0A2T5VEJ6_9HYPH|nr:hypothetical protein [Breoghania corrubedonensis]PTW62175.1 hypothetical protein C8N35_101212 [Breoghania corrubedonensis]
MTATPVTWAVIGTLGAIVFAATIALWARYGELIFVQSLLNGIAGCFG